MQFSAKVWLFFCHFPRFVGARDDDLFETRIVPQRVPLRLELEETIAERIRNALYRSDLFDGEIFLTRPTYRFGLD